TCRLTMYLRYASFDSTRTSLHYVLAALRMTHKALRAGQVRAFRRVDLDLLAFVDERRYLHDKAGLGFGGLGHAGSGGALQPGLGLNHCENDGLGQFDADGLAVEKLHLDLEIGDEVFDCVTQNFLG